MPKSYKRSLQQKLKTEPKRTARQASSEVLQKASTLKKKLHSIKKWGHPFFHFFFRVWDSIYLKAYHDILGCQGKTVLLKKHLRANGGGCSI
jgi:hypothetical protein